VFCCSGCRGAYDLINGWGLGDFYALRDQMRRSGAAQPAGTASRYDQFDTPEFLGPSTPVQHSDGLCSTELAVHGLHCAACAWLIERATANEPGLKLARVKMSDHTVRVIFDPSTTQLSRIARLLDQLGYRLTPLDRSRDNHLQVENRQLLIQIAIAGFLAANAMWIAVALYAGDFSGLAPEYRYFLGFMGTALGTLSVVGPGRTFFVGAWASLSARTPHMDVPVALGLAAGTIVGAYNAIIGEGHTYFDTLATLVFLLRIGRWIQFRQQQRAARAVDLMLRITPRHATLVDDQGGTTLMLVERLVAGNRIRVAAGESVAADGVIVAGSTQLDRSLLTGESVPAEVVCGDTVAAGTVNLASPIDVRVTAVGRDSRIGQVMQSIEAAAVEKVPLVQFADRIGGIFVVIITLLAAFTFLGWLSAGLSTATAHATALLIVACPCALAMATPLAISVGLGRAAKANILIRDGHSLQQLAAPGLIWFDKTGTLTAGRQAVSHVVGEIEGLRLAASIEHECQHPVADAILREAQRRRLTLSPNAALTQVQIGGVIGRADGCALVVGNQALLQAHGIEIPSALRQALDDLVAQGESPVMIAVNSRVTTLLGITDPLREGASELIAELKQRGWQVGMLSGDHQAIAQRVARAVDIPLERCHGGLSPEEKLAAIRESRGVGGTVVMVGDGANDAAALAAADVGVAVRGGAEVSLQAAPVFIGSGKLSSIAQLMRGAKRTTQLIYLSFAISLSYNLISVVLAMCGWISPLAAAVLMPISSVSVLAVTFGFKSFEVESRT
jgi:Cu2+-exporting ATPase